MKRVVVVEDNPVNRLLLRTILESCYDVAEYTTGTAALEGMAHRPPDLVLLDIFLPDLDGPEVLQRLRAQPALQSVPVIALTGNDEPGAREKFLNAGFDDYVAKSLTDVAVLLAAIERQLAPERA